MRRRVTMVLASAALAGSLVATDAQARGGSGAGHIGGFAGGRIGGLAGGRIAGIHPGVHQVHLGLSRFGYGRRDLVEYARRDLVRGGLSGSASGSAVGSSANGTATGTGSLASTGSVTTNPNNTMNPSGNTLGPSPSPSGSTLTAREPGYGFGCPYNTSYSLNCTYGGQTNTSATQSAP
jgi:hypothetical protein